MTPAFAPAFTGPDFLILVFSVGLATWALRFGPIRLRLTGGDPEGWLRRFLAASGPAAIATLFCASVLPMLAPGANGLGPLLAGTLAVLGVFAWRRSVVLATLAGALSYGLTVALIG